MANSRLWTVALVSVLVMGVAVAAYYASAAEDNDVEEVKEGEEQEEEDEEGEEDLEEMGEEVGEKCENEGDCHSKAREDMFSSISRANAEKESNDLFSVRENEDEARNGKVERKVNGKSEEKGKGKGGGEDSSSKVAAMEKLYIETTEAAKNYLKGERFDKAAEKYTEAIGLAQK